MNKAEQRKSVLAARASLEPELREKFSLDICRKLLALEEVQGADIIFSYMAAGEEVNLRPLHNALLKAGKKLVFPVSKPGGLMNVYLPKSWRIGLYGIREPDIKSAELILPEEISLVLAPCVGFDGTGNRLGHGVGYYDRYLPKCENATVIAVAFEAQRLEKIPADIYDRKMDMAVTEKGIYRF